MALPNQKKRPSSGGPGGPSKKPRFDSKPSHGKPYSKAGNSKPNGSGKPVRRGGKGTFNERDVKPKTELKRKTPITGSSRAWKGDDGEDDFEGEDLEDEDVIMDDGKGYEEVPMEGDVDMDAEAKGDGKRMSKAEKLALHASQPHRTSLLPSAPLLRDTLLPLWEEARRADLSKEERSKKIKELYEGVKGRVREVARGHKGGRVLQTIVKYGGKEERTGIANELDGMYKQMLESKYSKFLMAKLIHHCPSVRLKIISQLSPHIPSLLSHSHAVNPLSDFYELYSTSKERKLLVRSFYPKEVLLFDGLGLGGSSDEARDEIRKKVEDEGKEVKGLVGTLEGMGDGAGRTRVLDQLQETINDVFNSTQKEALAQAIFHKLLLEWLQAVYLYLPADAADKKMHELLDTAIESLPDIVHTRDGASVVREILARGIAKDRKNVLRVMKPHLEKLCQDGEAQAVLFTAFDVVDDTKMMGKAILADIGQMAGDLALHKTGRRVLLYLLAPRSTRHFIPSTVKDLEATDASAAATSKKDKNVRRKELKAAISPDLLKLVEERGEELMRDAGASLLVIEVMLDADGDKTAAMEGILSPIATAYPNPASADPEADPTTAPLLDLSYAVRAYKTILSGGRFNAETKQVDSPDTELRQTFARRFWETITSEEAGGEQNAVNVAVGNAPFVVVELVESLRNDEKYGKQLKSVLGAAAVIEEVKGSWRKGANLLHEKLLSL